MGPSDSLLLVLYFISDEVTLSCEQLLPFLFLQPEDLHRATIPDKQRQFKTAH